MRILIPITTHDDVRRFRKRESGGECLDCCFDKQHGGPEPGSYCDVLESGLEASNCRGACEAVEVAAQEAWEAEDDARRYGDGH